MKLIKAVLLLYILITHALLGQYSALRRQIENTKKYDSYTEVKGVPCFIVGIINDYKIGVDVFGPVPGTKIELKKDDYFEIGNISKAITYEVISLLEDDLDKIKTKRGIIDFLPLDLQNHKLD